MAAQDGTGWLGPTIGQSTGFPTDTPFADWLQRLLSGDPAAAPVAQGQFGANAQPVPFTGFTPQASAPASAPAPGPGTAPAPGPAAAPGGFGIPPSGVLNPPQGALLAGPTLTPPSAANAPGDSLPGNAPPTQQLSARAAQYQQPGAPQQSQVQAPPPLEVPQRLGGGGVMGHLTAAANNLGSGTNPIAGLVNSITGLATGVRTDPEGIMLQQQQATAEAIYKGLVSGGRYSPQQAQGIAIAAAGNPALAQAILPQAFGGRYKPAETGTDFLGTKSVGSFDETTGTYRDVYGRPLTANGRGGGGAPGGVPGGGVGPSGNAFAGSVTQDARGNELSGPPLMAHLKKNYPMYAAGVQGIIDGDINAAGHNLQKMLPLAMLVDPTLNQSDFATRARTRQFYTTGSGGKEIKAANTAIYHAAELNDLIDKLPNTDWFPWVSNNVSQAVMGQTSPEFQKLRGNYETKVEALAGELSKAFNGGNTSDADRKNWRDILMQTKGPSELHGAVQGAMRLLLGRFNAAAENYNQGMQTTREGMHFVDKGNLPIFNKLMGGGHGAATAASTPAPASANAPVTVDQIETEMKRRGLVK